MTSTSTATDRSVLFFAGMIATFLIAFLILPLNTRAALLTSQLDFGMSGSNVSSLQTFLATDQTIYPQGLVTGYFGFLTKSAVSNFQSRNGLDPVGRVGPLTLVMINAQMGGSGVSNTVEGAGKVTNYGTLQPVLSNIQITSAASSTATITWDSSVPATARVRYSTVWPFNYNTAPTVTSSMAPATAQSVTLSNLQSNTVYYYVLESLDASGNFTWSTNGVSFTAR